MQAMNFSSQPWEIEGNVDYNKLDGASLARSPLTTHLGAIQRLTG